MLYTSSWASLHRPLLERTVRLALSSTLRRASTSIVPASITSIVEGVLTSMLLNTLKWTTLGILVGGLALSGVAVMARQDAKPAAAKASDPLLLAGNPPPANTIDTKAAARDARRAQGRVAPREGSCANRRHAQESRQSGFDGMGGSTRAIHPITDRAGAGLSGVETVDGRRALRWRTGPMRRSHRRTGTSNGFANWRELAAIPLRFEPTPPRPRSGSHRHRQTRRKPARARVKDRARTAEARTSEERIRSRE